MDKDISLKGMEVQLPNSITNYDDYSNWGSVNITRKDDYIVVNRNNAAGGWGIVSNRIGQVKGNTPYIVEFDYRTNDLEGFSYNYFISSDGNQAITRINTIADGKWHTTRLEVESGKDRSNCGMLIGTDYRNTPGNEYNIRNIRLYPKYNADLSGVEVKEILSYKNNRWEKAIGYIKSKKWIEFIRPVIQATDDSLNVTGMYILNDTTLRDDGIRFGSQGNITVKPTQIYDDTKDIYGMVITNTNTQRDNGIRFGEETIYTVAQINPNLISYSEIYDSAAEMDKSKYKETGEIILTAAGTYQGLFIRYPDVKPNTVYSFSYEYEVLDGDLVTFGGHADATYGNNKCYLNGNYMTDNYNEWDSVYDPNTIKNQNYAHIVITTSNDVVPLNRLFIQPNRGRGEMVKVRISNMKLEKGKKVTPWSYDKE